MVANIGVIFFFSIFYGVDLEFIIQYLGILLFLSTKIKRKRGTWEEKDTIKAWMWVSQRIATPHFLPPPMLSFYFLSSVLSVLDHSPWDGAVLPIFKMGFSHPPNSLWKCPHKHTQKFTSLIPQAFISLLKLIITS